jgi:GT2 family glycosyltransferase
VSPNAKIGAVTVTYNSEAVIDDFLQSMIAQSHSNFALYVVDNASSDCTLARIAGVHDPRIRVIANAKNYGFAEASNQGIHVALNDECDSVLLINNDTQFESDLLDELLHGMIEHHCDMVAPKILYHENRRLIWSAGGGFNPWKGYAGFHYGLNQLDQGQFEKARSVGHAPACCLLVKKHVFDRIGFMDPRYFVYLDDTDFCYRAVRAGLKIVYLPSAILLHKASTLTGGPDSEFSIRYRTRNQIYFMLKHLGIWRALYYLPAFQILQLARFFVGKVTFRNLMVREKAFIEGFRVWMEAIR